MKLIQEVDSKTRSPATEEEPSAATQSVDMLDGGCETGRSLETVAMLQES